MLEPILQEKMVDEKSESRPRVLISWWAEKECKGSLQRRYVCCLTPDMRWVHVEESGLQSKQPQPKVFRAPL